MAHDPIEKLTEVFKRKEKTFSFELFPPKTEEGYQKLLSTLIKLIELNPDFISCTYGAGGGNREKTFDIVQHIQEKHNTIGVAHLTCVLNTKNQIKSILEDINSRGIKNILALRGDPPLDQPDWQPSEDNFKYSSELCEFTRTVLGETFGIGVAGFPEGHILCKDRDLDAHYLKLKIDAGANFVITQIYFDNKDYFDYIKRLKKLDIDTRVIPGILPITNYQNLLKFCNLCGTTVTEEIKRIFEPIQNDKEATLEEGIKFSIRQCRELLDNGAPGIHFYTLNRLSPTDKILSSLL